MNRAAITGFIAASFPLTASAGTVFSSRAAFESAVGTFSIIDFESESLNGSAGSGALAMRSFTGFSAASTPAAIKVLDVPAFGSQNTTPGGSRYLYLDTDIGFQGSSTTFTLDAPTSFVGFDFTAMGEDNNVFTIDVNGQTIEISSGTTIIDGFFGYISNNGPITEFTLNTTTDSGYGIDDITLIPAPAPAAAFITAAALFGRRRRA